MASGHSPSRCWNRNTTSRTTWNWRISERQALDLPVYLSRSRCRDPRGFREVRRRSGRRSACSANSEILRSRCRARASIPTRRRWWNRLSQLELMGAMPRELLMIGMQGSGFEPGAPLSDRCGSAFRTSWTPCGGSFTDSPSAANRRAMRSRLAPGGTRSRKGRHRAPTEARILWQKPAPLR